MRRRDGIPHRKIAPDRSDPGRLILDWGQFAGAGWAAGAVSAAGAGSSGAGNGVACGSVAAGASTGVEGAGERFEEVEKMLLAAKRHLGDELHDKYRITLDDMKPEYVA